MISAATRNAFEVMTEAGSGDAGALALGLRREVTSLGLRALAAKALHVAAAAPERVADIYDNAAAGWLSGPVFPPKLRTDDPLPISPGFWKAFWGLVNLPADERRRVFAERTLMLAGELDPRINGRMAATALDFKGVADVDGGIPEPFDPNALAAHGPATLGFALRQELMRNDAAAYPFSRSIVPLLRHMPHPLDRINIEVVQSLPLLALVAGYTPRATLDHVALGGFLMGQAAHHYSALSSAVTLTVMSLERPESLELMLDSLFKGWVHGRETPLLIGAPWHEMWDLRVDEVRETLGVTAFDSPHGAALRQLTDARPKPH